MHNYNWICSGRLVVSFFVAMCQCGCGMIPVYLEILNLQRKMHGSLKQTKGCSLEICCQHLQYIWDKINVIIFSCRVLKRTFTIIQSITCCWFYGNCGFSIILSSVDSEMRKSTSAPESLQLEEIDANRW